MQWHMLRGTASLSGTEAGAQSPTQRGVRSHRRTLGAGLAGWRGQHRDGDFSFPLESVKKLKDLQEVPEPKVQGRRKFVTPPLCSHPGFPEELRPVCSQPNAEDILHRLEAIAQDPSTCEICAYAACAGC
ncbi:PREDICTED: guanylin isoform X1 [Chinchilla lanigera]|uniref:guanylin isoform X1 n=1 Tax=Chinchilla lanigera TaxID=34839 RepID=UPI00069797B7|nr:PREDICTED: guanylin isoform X1 [Chinchilla lanigera]